MVGAHLCHQTGLPEEGRACSATGGRSAGRMGDGKLLWGPWSPRPRLCRPSHRGSCRESSPPPGAISRGRPGAGAHGR